MEKPKFIAFVCNAKIFANVSFKILRLVRVFGWSNKAYLYVFDLFLFQVHLTNIGFINILCHVLSCHVVYRKTIMVDLSESMLNLAVQPLKTYLLPHYHNAYNHQTWQGDDLPWGASTKITLTFWSFGLARSQDKLKMLYLHYQSASGHQT